MSIISVVPVSLPDIVVHVFIVLGEFMSLLHYMYWDLVYVYMLKFSLLLRYVQCTCTTKGDDKYIQRNILVHSRVFLCQANPTFG